MTYEEQIREAESRIKTLSSERKRIEESHQKMDDAMKFVKQYGPMAGELLKKFLMSR